MSPKPALNSKIERDCDLRPSRLRTLQLVVLLFGLNDVPIHALHEETSVQLIHTTPDANHVAPF